MSSIYIKAAAFLYQGSREKDQHHSIPLLVFHRGLFDCMAPRIEQILPQQCDYFSCKASRSVFIASNACTYHLTREAFFAFCSMQDVPATVTAMSELSQVASLTLMCGQGSSDLEFEFDCEFELHHVFAELTRYSLTLTRLEARYDARSPFQGYSDSFMHALASGIAELHNLQELKITSLTPELCDVVAAGPGARLHHLDTSFLFCQPADFDVLVAGCPNILTLRLKICSFDFVLSGSKLQYLQSVQACLNDSPSEADMRIAFSSMERLTKLNLRSPETNFSDAIAAIIATTVGPRLVEFTLNSRVFSSDAFATLCCASSFPQLEVMSLRSPKSVIEHDVTVSLSPSLLHLTLSNFELSPRTLTQLLSNKSKLKKIELDRIEFSPCGRNDEDTTAETPATEDDWFGELVKSPVHELHIDASVLPASDTRIALLAPTLVDVGIGIYHWSAPPDLFLSLMFSSCVLLERFYIPTSSVTAIDAKVAFSGLRNNERLRSLDMDCNISSPSALVEELLAMRSTELQHLKLFRVFNIERCVDLAKRFVHLESVSGVAEHSDRQVLQQRFPRVSWEE